jgi:hypothetical protein
MQKEILSTSNDQKSDKNVNYFKRKRTMYLYIEPWKKRAP